MISKYRNIAVTVIMAALLAALSIWCWLKPADDFSDSERRVLAQFPELSAETLLSGEFMKDFETYTLDQFPERDGFRTIKALSELKIFGKKDNNDIYIADGYVSKLEYPMSEPMLQNAADKFRYIYETFMAGKSVKPYFSIVPDKNYFLADKNGYLSMDYDKLVEFMTENTEYMEYIDIFPLLSIEDYYYTDTHWRQENILDVADKIASEMGVILGDEYEVNTLDIPFNGVYVGQSALPLEPDTIKYLMSETLKNCTVTSYDTGMPVQVPVYNMEKAAGKDAYELFLSGNQALLVIENPNAKTDKELVVFRDSFGGSLIPLLTEGYAKITVVDIRYIQSGMIGGFVNFDDQDVLFIYSTMLLNSSTAFK